MSSLPEKSQPLAAVAGTTTTSIVAKPTTTTFFRSDSIQKIKCSALYPFQVAGIKLSKSVIIELLETNMQKARICTQKTMLNFYCVILKLLSTLFTLFDNKAAVKTGAQQITVDSESSRATKANDPKTLTTDKPSIESYQTRLDERLNKIQKHKSRLNGVKLFASCSAVPTTSDVTPAVTSTNDLTCLTACKGNSSSADNLRLFNLRSRSLVLTNTKCKEYLLVVCVHASLVVMYLQIVILGIALNTTNVPLGLIFLIATIVIIGYIFVKVSLVEHPVATKSPKSSPLPKSKSSRRSRDLIKDDFSPERPSRSKAKKIPISELQYKTLSKIKLL